MALRIRLPFVLDLAIVRDDAEMARLNNDPAISREVSGRGGLFHRFVRRRIESLRVDGDRRLPVFEPRTNQARADAQAEAERRLTELAAAPQPFDRHAVATLARYVAGHAPAVPVGVAVQHLVGRMLDPAYVATEASYRAARDVAAVFSSCPVTALRVLVWTLTGRLARSKQHIWTLAGNDPVIIHATAIAMHQVVDSLARMRAAMRADGPWDTTPAEAAAWALSAPPRLVRECVLKSGGRRGFRPGTLLFFSLRAMHEDTESNDLALSRKQWSQCPAHAIVPRLLAEVWAAAVRERATERYRRHASLGRRLLLRPLLAAMRWLNRRVAWYQLPGWGLRFLNLYLLREELRDRNLHDTSLLPASSGAAPAPLPTPDVLRYRTADGSFNSLEDPTMGQAGTRFGRNVPLGYTYPEEPKDLLDPSPRRVSRELLTRETFEPATGLNVLASAWIQFQVHDWFDHDIDQDRALAIPLEESDPWPAGQRPMRVGRTRADHTRGDDPPVGAPTYLNPVTHWWDASQLYGSDLATQRRLRTMRDGKLVLDSARRLPRGADGIEITGFTKNWWLGLSLFHQLFTLEHNAICDRLRVEYPGWGDEQLFQTARLVNAALIAKIHDLEWVPIVLGDKAVRKGLEATWWGLLGKRFVRAFGRLPGPDMLTGIPGSATDHHGAPYAITEEFVAVYRMHAFMMPDAFDVFEAATGSALHTLPLPAILGPGAGHVVDKYDFADLFYSFARNVPGKLTLGNYATLFQQFQPTSRAPLVDLASIDILRDRERGVPRYNTFRQLLHLPPVESFEALNERWAPALRRVYGTVDRIDLLVGLLAEATPPRFGFSDTTFRVFLLMNSRRRKSDRFYTRDYTAAVYTQTGLDWVADNELRSVLLRHYPGLERVLRGVPNVFGPWRTAPAR